MAGSPAEPARASPSSARRARFVGVRQLWLRRIETLPEVETVLRHRAFRDRAAVENALSRYFFTPFEHQEVCEGDHFARRAAWSRAALAGLEPGWVEAVADRRVEAWLPSRPSRVPSLLEAVRRLPLSLMCELLAGREHAQALAVVAEPAIRNIDGCIKMMARPDPRARRALSSAMAILLEQPVPEASLLAAARAAGVELEPGELRDHLVAVFLGTGVIQLSDVLTHALITRAQHPLSVEDASTMGWLRETLRCFPVNASVTRLARGPADVGGASYALGDAITFYPQSLNQGAGDDFRPARWDAPDGGPQTFAFGWGPRACPAQRFSLHLLAHLLGRLQTELRLRIPRVSHRRSLAWPIPAALGRPDQRLDAPPRPQRARDVARYVATCADTYPRAFFAAGRLLGGLGRG